VTAALDLAVAALLVRPWGTAGAVAANTVAQVTVSVWAFVALRRLKGVRIPLADLSRIGVAAALALLAALAGSAGTHSVGVVSVLVGTAAGLGTYLLACVLLGALSTRDFTVLMASGRRLASFKAGA